jgi:hypothetical protein
VRLIFRERKSSLIVLGAYEDNSAFLAFYRFF